MGHMPAGYGSYVPWGLWIAIYFHGVGIAGGAFVVGAMGYILGARGLGTASMLRTVIVLSIAAMVPSFMAVYHNEADCLAGIALVKGSYNSPVVKLN